MRALSLRGILTLCILGALCGAPSEAHAYVRTMTCDPFGGGLRPCDPGEQPRAVYWPNSCITYYVQRDGARDLDGDADICEELLQTIQTSFTTWSTPACSKIRLVFGGLTCNTNTGPEPDVRVRGGEQPLVTWREQTWPHAQDALALTTLSYETSSGAITDADIEVNGIFFTFGDLTQPAPTTTGVHDVQNTITHEVGHVVGFAHEPSVTGSTMFPIADPGELSKRDLHSDDIAGLCEVYPSAGDAPICLPARLDDQSCVVAATGEPACHMTPPRRGSLPDFGWWLVVVVMGWMRRHTSSSEGSHRS